MLWQAQRAASRKSMGAAGSIVTAYNVMRFSQRSGSFKQNSGSNSNEGGGSFSQDSGLFSRRRRSSIRRMFQRSHTSSLPSSPNPRAVRRSSSTSPNPRAGRRSSQSRAGHPKQQRTRPADPAYRFPRRSPEEPLPVLHLDQPDAAQTFAMMTMQKKSDHIQRWAATTIARPVRTI
jgi:hypothetical protein